MTDQLELAETTGDAPGGFLALLDNAAEQVAEEKPGRSSSASRRAAYQQMLKDFDLPRLIEMREKMARLLDQIVLLRFDEPPLTPDMAHSMMTVMLNQAAVTEMMMAVREMIRSAVFAHLDYLGQAAGYLDPEYRPGEIPVPSMGKRFVREGCGRQAPTFDEDAFREALGDRADLVFEKVKVRRQVIPAHVEYVLSPDKVLELVNKDPAVLETLRGCLTPGNYRSPRFAVRDMKEPT